MTVKIRKIEKSDFPTLVALFKEFALIEKLSVERVNSVEQMFNEQESLKGFVAADEENKILGYVTYFFIHYTFFGKSMYLNDLYVRPEYRAKSIGTQLIKHVITYAKDKKCKKMRWQVSKWNKPAIEFYKSIGKNINNVESDYDLVF